MHAYGALAVCIFGILAGSSAAAENPKTFQDCETCPQMVIVPSVTAMLGSEPYEANRKKGDSPQREVTLAYTLAVGKTEVSRAQYRKFMDETGHEMLQNGCNTWGSNRILGYVKAHNWDSPGFPQNEKHPVVCVSHSDATAYVTWLAAKTGKPYRLLSSTEWEYAARAGTRGPWFWGPRVSDACEYANIGDDNFRRAHTYAPVFNCDDGYEHTAPVGSYKPNLWGLHDMIGNAWEWTDDCMHLENPNKLPLDGSAWLEEDGGVCERRLPRGGGWVSGTDWARAGARAFDFAVYHSQLLGFRVGMTVKR